MDICSAAASESALGGAMLASTSRVCARYWKTYNTVGRKGLSSCKRSNASRIRRVLFSEEEEKEGEKEAEEQEEVAVVVVVVRVCAAAVVAVVAIVGVGIVDCGVGVSIAPSVVAKDKKGGDKKGESVLASFWRSK
jgi:hypothetical protein